jgi:hypothetical protein
MIGPIPITKNIRDTYIGNEWSDDRTEDEVMKQHFAEKFDAWFAPYADSHAIIQKIRARHKPIQFGSRTVCAHCTQQDYPCPVIKALDGEKV